MSGLLCIHCPNAWRGFTHAFAVRLDDVDVARVARGRVVGIRATPGTHTLQARLRDWRSPVTTVSVREGERRCFVLGRSPVRSGWGEHDKLRGPHLQLYPLQAGKTVEGDMPPCPATDGQRTMS